MLNSKTIPIIDGMTAGNLVRKSNSKPTISTNLLLYILSQVNILGGGGERATGGGGG